MITMKQIEELINSLPKEDILDIPGVRHLVIGSCVEHYAKEAAKSQKPAWANELPDNKPAQKQGEPVDYNGTPIRILNMVGKNTEMECNICGGRMSYRLAKTRHSLFMGCVRFPGCDGFRHGYTAAANWNKSPFFGADKNKTPYKKEEYTEHSENTGRGGFSTDVTDKYPNHGEHEASCSDEGLGLYWGD